MIDLAKILKDIDRLNRVLNKQATPEQKLAVVPFQTKLNEAVRAMKSGDVDKINEIIKDLKNADISK